MKEKVRKFGGKAAFIAFQSKLEDYGVSWEGLPTVFEDLPEAYQEAFIAAAHEANWLQWAIENNNEEVEPKEIA